MIPLLNYQTFMVLEQGEEIKLGPSLKGSLSTKPNDGSPKNDHG